MSATAIRTARPADTATYAALFDELGLDEPVPSTARLGALISRMQIVEHRGAPAGFAVGDVEGEVGFVRQLVIAPEARRQGLGRALLRAAARRLRAQGASELRLNVKIENRAAISLYESEGLRVEFDSAALWAEPGLRARLPGAATPLSVFEPPPSYDLLLEGRFRLSPGQLARARDAGKVVRAVARAGRREDPRGLMRFDPGFPGAFPFCADDPAASRALLGEIEAQLAPRPRRFGLVVERQPQLTAALLSAGARLRFRMVQMRAPL